MNFEGLPTFGVARSCRLAEEANILLVVVVGASGTFDLSKHLFFGRTTLDKGLGVKPLHRGKAMSWFHRFQSLNHAKKRVAWFQSCFEGKRGSGDDEDVLRFNSDQSPDTFARHDNRQKCHAERDHGLCRRNGRLVIVNICFHS